ncbi:MAG: transcription antitermination factor NusB [Armatimonadetes bacterium]|jgi:N utilization substance protein B|nr:transcription antitermination factor NusB [Armatimonadota bacterium]
MSKRRSARELALKILFQIEVGKFTPEDALATSFEQVSPPEDDRTYAEDLVLGVARRAQELDQIIGDLAQGWSLDRLAKVDKNVLRLSLYELIDHQEIPANVVINDAVEVARKYSTDDSGRFVNGILGSFLRGRDQTGAEGETESRADADE